MTKIFLTLIENFEKETSGYLIFIREVNKKPFNLIR